MALWKRKPKTGLIWHSDRGSQYASESHREILKDYKIKQSMSRKGDCWDNAVSESFFHTLKTELVHHMNFKNRQEAKSAIFEYISKFFITENAFTQLMIIYHLRNTSIIKKSVKNLSRKRLPDHTPVLSTPWLAAIEVTC